MTTHFARHARNFVCLISLVLIAACATPKPSGAAPFAAIVQDARTGQILYSENADTRLHPASLTKMMTLYITFQEIERGAIGLDSMITVSRNAASLPPSRLGLKPGQKIALRYLIRAAAIKSANDAAQAIGDHIGGDQERFAARMTKTARALGMSNTTFKNANGLTANGHLSTAADMNLLGRRLFYDFPQYYNIFSRRTTDAGMTTVRNTNSRFLDAYPGADGIKTGYTSAAGFNLTASAERGRVRIITTVFGGKSTAWRNAKMADLMDIGFRKAPANAKTQPLPAPSYQIDVESALLASADGLPEVEDGVGKTIRLKTAVATSLRAMPRPNLAKIAETEVAMAAIEGTIAAALAEAVAEPTAPATLDAQTVASVEDAPILAPDAAMVLAATAPPARSNTGDATDAGVDDALAGVVVAAAPAVDMTLVSAAQDIAATSAGTLQPQTANPVTAAAPPQATDLAVARVEVGADEDPVPTGIVQLAAVAAPAVPVRNTPNFDSVALQATDVPMAEPVVIRLSTSNARHYGVHLGKFNTRSEAERLLLKTQLSESATLNEGLRKVVQNGGGYQANFMGLTQDQADLVCRRLQARAVNCMTMGP